jgi:gliding motility-associated-like protein
MKKLYLLINLILLSFIGVSQNDCMGTQSSVVNPQPVGGGYAPGTVVQYCVTYNNWNTNLGSNWCEGFDITIGPGWVPGSITSVTLPNNLNGGNGQWLWVPGVFNSNPISSGGAGNNFGPGFFFDEDNDGATNDDWGDFGTGPWTFCFNVTVGSVAGTSLSLQVSPVSDGYAGSWGNAGCNGEYQYQLSPGTTVLGCIVPPVVTQSSVTDATCSGFADGSFNVVGSNGVSPYIYYVNGVITPMPVNNVLAGVYIVTCEDDDGCNSLPINVTVGENTTVVNNTSQLQDNVCFGESNGSFTISSVNGLLPYTYTLNGGSNNTGIFTNLPSGNYVVNVSDDNGCNTNHNVTITEPTQLTNTIPIITDIDCFGNTNGTVSVTANNGTPPYTYTLNGGSNNTGSFTNLGAGTYSMDITDDNSCQINIPSIVISGPAQPLQGNLSTVQPTCFGYSDGSISSVVIGGTPPYTYLWNNLQITSLITNLSSGWYQVVVTDDNLCQTTLTHQLNQPMLIDLTGDNSEVICFGEDVYLSVSQINAITPYNIIWTNSVNATTNNNDTWVVPPSNTTYTATLVDNNGCTATHNFNVIVNPLPDPSFTQSDITGCNPKCIDFSIINPNPNYTYDWSMGTGANRTGSMFSYCYSKDGLYDIGVIATTNLGCKDTIYKPNHIIINLSPTAQFSISPESVTDIMSPYFEFGNLSKDGMTYFWSFGDSQTSTDENTEHSYISSGEYCIKLIATSSYNTGIPTCSDSIINCVTINPLSVLYIPEAFTPNGDGINDYFFVKSSRIYDYHLTIFNRWGSTIFQTYDLETVWDGTYGTNIVQDGVYYYFVSYRDVEMKIYVKNGTVTLLK